MNGNTHSYKSRKALKDQVKNIFKGKWLTLAVLFGLLLNFPVIFWGVLQYFLMGILGITSMVFSDRLLEMNLQDAELLRQKLIVFCMIGGVLFFIIQLLLLPVVIGTQFKLLEKIRGSDQSSNFWDTILVIYKKGKILKFIFLYLVMAIFISLWTLLLIIPGIIKSFSYSQAFYIWYDSLKSGKELTALESITQSRQLMDGKKIDLFVLYLSFIGWSLLVLVIYLVCVVMLGYCTQILGLAGLLLGIIVMIIPLISLLCLLTYVTTTLAAFYNDIAGIRSDDELTKQHNDQSKEANLAI